MICHHDCIILMKYYQFKFFKMKHVILIFTLFFAGHCLEAQDPDTTKRINRVGLSVGLVSSQMIYLNDIASELGPELDPTGALIMPSLGFYAETGGGEYFTSTVGLFYESKGYTGEGDVRLKLDYIQFPVLLRVRLPIVGPVAFKAGAGGYISYAFNGVLIDSEGDTNRDIISFPKNDVEENKFIRAYDIGLLFGGAFEVELGGRLLEISYDYQVGLSDVTNKTILVTGDGLNVTSEEVEFSLRNRSSVISLKYAIIK